MPQQKNDEFTAMLREQGVQYVVDSAGQPVAVLLAVEEYEHYLDLMEDEADSQDAELAQRLTAAAQSSREERLSFREYMVGREAMNDDVQS